jgi:hypothetical protein
MTDAWFENAVMPDGLPIDGCRQEEADALKVYLRDHITVDQACLQITLPTHECAKPGDPLIYMWGLLQDAMLEIPGCQKKVVDLLHRIQQLPDVKLGKEQHEGALSNEKSVLWRDLPGFGDMWYDGNWWVYGSHWRTDAAYSTPERKAVAVNQAIGEATMAKSGLMGDYVGFDGLSRLAHTLEHESADLEVEIPMVREWVVCAGDLLRGMCEAPPRTSNSVDGSDYEAEAERRMRCLPNKRSLWQDNKGPSLERWNFWKERLRQIEGDQDIKQAVREAAKVAVGAMN